MSVLKIVGRAAVAFYDELFFYFIAGLGHVATWLLIIPGPFGLVGIYIIGQRSVRGQGVSWAGIWAGIREYGFRSLLLFLITVGGYAVVAANIWFYITPDVSPFPDSVAAWTTPAFLGIGLLWTGITFYAQSFLMELEDPRLKNVFRNSLVLTILKPLQTLFLVIVAIIVLGVSVVLPFLLILSPGFVSVLALTAVRTMVSDISEARQLAQSANNEQTADSGEAPVAPDAGA